MMRDLERARATFAMARSERGARARVDAKVRFAFLGGVALALMACGIDARTFSEPVEGAASGSGGAPSASSVETGVPPQVGSATRDSDLDVTSGTSQAAYAGSGGTGGSASSASGTGGALGSASGAGTVGGANAGGASAASSSAGGQATGAATEPATPEPGGPCGLRLAGPLVTRFDDVLATVANNLANLDRDAQINVRYLLLTNRQSAGAPACELQAIRRLLLAMLASLRVDPSIPDPIAIDSAAMIYRIDLRALGWNVSVRLHGDDFIDTWEGIARSSPYAVRFEGDAADDAVVKSGTEYPVLFATALIEQVLADVPPLPFGQLATLRRDAVMSGAIGRVSAPVESADVAGDLGISLSEFTTALPLLDPRLAPLRDGSALERAVYAPLFLSSLCLVSAANPNHPTLDSCEL